MFRRKSKWDQVSDVAAAVAANAAIRRALGVGGGVVAGAVGLTALSAAVSTTRERSQK